MTESADLIDKLRIGPDSGDDRARWPWGRLAIIGAVLLALTVIVVWWLSAPDAVEAQVVSPEVIEVGTGASRSAVLDASGYVVARLQATVSAKVTGKIAEVLVEEGMRVEEGQVLARLDDILDQSELELAGARLSAAESAVREVEVALADARRTLRRQEDLHQRNLTSQSEVDLARTQVETLEVRLQARRDDVRIARLSHALQRQRVDELTIRAPFAGVVVAKAAQPGEMVSPISAGGGFTRTGICTIVDMDSLEIEVDVNEAYIQRVSAGQPAIAILDAYPDWEIPARVIAIVPTADRQRATVRVRVGLLEQDARVLPDMGVRVRFLEPERQETQDEPVARRGLELPATAVLREDGRQFVFVVDGGRVERRAVQLSDQRAGRVVIGAGLGADEKVVADITAVSLSNNQRISVKGD